MTVAELIAVLQTIAPEIEVLIDSDHAENQPLRSVFLYGADPAVLILDCGDNH